MTFAKQKQELKLVISIGANIPSKLGDPIRTIASTRPLIERSIIDWHVALNFPKVQQENHDMSLFFKWAPLFETDPLGCPSNQPKFINTVLLVEGNEFKTINPTKKAAISLMREFLELEKIAGRERANSDPYGGPRPLDIDFLCWGELQLNTETLILPHPRFSERNFVLIPLTEVLAKTQGKPRRIKPQDIWPE